MFKKDGDGKDLWKLEYFDTVYKIYDWDKNLAGYFFPDYKITDNGKYNQEISSEEYDFDEDTETIDKMNKEKHKVLGGNLMLPMIKLNLLDNEDGIDLNYVINDLENNIQRTHKWNQWITQNNKEFHLIGASVYTSREDRNMLSIVIGTKMPMRLGEKELLSGLKLLLNRLHYDGLI